MIKVIIIITLKLMKIIIQNNGSGFLCSYMSSRRRKSLTPSIPQDKNEIEKTRQESVAMKAKIRSVMPEG